MSTNTQISDKVTEQGVVSQSTGFEQNYTIPPYNVELSSVVITTTEENPEQFLTTVEQVSNEESSKTTFEHLSQVDNITVSESLEYATPQHCIELSNT